MALTPLGPEIFSETPILREDPALCQDVLGLLQAASMISSLGHPSLYDNFTHALSRLESPDQAAMEIVRVIKREVSDLTKKVSACLQSVGDIARALEVLILSLELDRGIVSHAEEFETSWSAEMQDDDDDEGFTEGGGRRSVFASPLGISVVAVSLNQMATTRCRAHTRTA